MNVPELFIRRPVMTTLVMSGILLFGLIGYRLLPVSDLPSVDYPTIQVSASLPGANPDTMASSVATPLEKQFSIIAGMDSMSSVSALGSVQITIQFTLSRNIDAAAQDVQAAIAKAARQLPPNMPTPPTYQKVNPADAPILFLSPVAHAPAFRWTITPRRCGAAHFHGRRCGPGWVFGSQHMRCACRWILIRWLPTGSVWMRSKAPVSGNAACLRHIYGHQQAFTVQANGQL